MERKPHFRSSTEFLNQPGSRVQEKVNRAVKKANLTRIPSVRPELEGIEETLNQRLELIKQKQTDPISVMELGFKRIGLRRQLPLENGGLSDDAIRTETRSWINTILREFPDQSNQLTEPMVIDDKVLIKDGKPVTRIDYWRAKYINPKAG